MPGVPGASLFPEDLRKDESIISAMGHGCMFLFLLLDHAHLHVEVLVLAYSVCVLRFRGASLYSLCT
jgi:hypothetical protein